MVDHGERLEALSHLHDDVARVAEIQNIDARAVWQRGWGIAVAHGKIVGVVAKLLPGGPRRPETVSAIRMVEDDGLHRPRSYIMQGDNELDLTLRERSEPGALCRAVGVGPRGLKGRGKNNYQVFVVIHLLQG